MKALVIGDQHFKVDNLEQVDIFISNLRKLLENNKYDFIVSGGDLLDTHERLHTLCLNKADQYLKLLCSFAKTFVLVGNHDMINPSQFLTTNHWLNVYKDWTQDLIIVDKVINYKVGNKTVIFSPYVPDGRFVEALNTNNKWTEADVIFCHQTLDGVKMGAITAENVEEWKDEYPNLIAFHVHDSQNVKKNLFYTGSCMQHSFGESCKKYLYEVVDCIDLVKSTTTQKHITMNKNIFLNKIDLNLPKKKIVHLFTEELEDVKTTKDLEKLIPKNLQTSDYQLKIVVSGSSTDFKMLKKRAEIKKLFDKYKVVFKNEVIKCDRDSDQVREIVSFNDEFDLMLTDFLKGKEEGLLDFYKSLF
jgi:DNA repair exonuclease SbcCD nuclease subunit